MQTSKHSIWRICLSLGIIILLSLACSKDSGSIQGSSWKRESTESWVTYPTGQGAVRVSEQATEYLIFKKGDEMQYNHSGGHNGNYSATYRYSIDGEVINLTYVSGGYPYSDVVGKNYAKVVINGETLTLTTEGGVDYIYQRVKAK